ncbi:toll/interleukin-1 receptor domain-containing protein [Terricaulis sp.]|uniref:toll/interleukin-1 receptor domain-containing protein n=1 Tax=Terricaulis sp. TaxID=2768686 RepID=UPI003783448B
MARGEKQDQEEDIFISYQRDTADKARKLAAALERPNRKVWLDQKMLSDTRWRADIEKKLRRARCVVTIWSKKAATSGWVNYEAFRAQQEGKLIAVTFDPIVADDLPAWLSDQQITNLRGWKSKDDLNHNGWLNVSRAINAKCDRLPEYCFKGWLGGGATHERVTSLFFHPTEDARLISTGSEGGAALWLASRASAEARGVCDADGKPLAADPAQYGQDGRFSAPQPNSEYHKASIWRAQFSRDGEKIVLACRDGVARVFDRSLGRLFLELTHNEQCGMQSMAFAAGAKGQHKDGVWDACFLPDGHIVTVGGSRICVWTPDGRPVHAKPMQLSPGAQAMAVRVLNCDVLDGGVIVGDKLGKVRIIDPMTAEDFFLIDDRVDTSVHFALGPALVDGKTRQGVLAIVSESPLDSEIKFHEWSAQAFSKPRGNTILDDAPPVRSIALHPRAPVIAIGSSAVQPRLWDHIAHEPLPLGRAGWHDRGISAVAFSATGKFLAAGSDDGRISIWEDKQAVL